MAVRKLVGKKRSTPPAGATDVIDRHVMAFAEQLGWSLGTIRVKADSWLDREALRIEVASIRDGATRLLEHFNQGPLPNKVGVKQVAQPPTTRASRGPVDAPGKRHRKPPPQEAIDQRMGEPVGKQLGRKNSKHAMRYGRS